MAGLADNAPWPVRFAPLVGLKGQELWLILAAPQAEPDRTVTAWVNLNLAPAGGGRRLAGGRPAEGCLSFRTWAAQDRPAWPQMIYLEPTNRCNLRCIHCFWEERRDRFSSLDQALLTQALPALERAGLVESGGEGELLYDDALSGRSLDFLVNHAAGYALHLTTNGTMLSPALAERIVAGRRVARLFFSVDGATAATYQAIRRGSDFNKVVANIRLVSRRKAELRLPAPGIGLTMVGMRRNVAELPALVDLAAQVGADLVTMLPLIVNRPELADRKSTRLNSSHRLTSRMPSSA
jgi:molybdenum cofactor biosynthesis enzyme MoaA